MSFANTELTEHLDAIYGYSLGVTRDPNLAADITQDTVVRAMERRHQFLGDAPLRHWLIRIAHNIVIDRARRSDREVLLDEVEADWRDDEYTVDAAVVADRAATRDELFDALARLPFIYRSAIVLHDVEGFRSIDIADIADITLSAAKQRLRRGRMALVHALAAGDQRRILLKGVPMPCWDARQHISDYLDGGLDNATATTVESHLKVCPTCPPLYAAIVGVNDELGQLRDPDSVIEPEVEARLRDDISRSATEQ